MNEGTRGYSSSHYAYRNLTTSSIDLAFIPVHYDIDWYLPESLVSRAKSTSRVSELGGVEMSIYVDSLRQEDSGVLRCTAKRRRKAGGGGGQEVSSEAGQGELAGEREEEEEVEDVKHVVILKVESGGEFIMCDVTVISEDQCS